MHAELVIDGMGFLPNSKPASSPGRKLTANERGEDDEEELSPDETNKYRGLAARANFLAQNRRDIALAVKELCRNMSRPTARDTDALNRLARYLIGKQRVIVHSGWQAAPE